MKKFMNITLTALSLSLLATQTLAADLKPQPGENEGTYEVGIMVGQITDLNDPRDNGYYLRSSKMSGKISGSSYSIANPKVFAAAKNTAKTKNPVLIEYNIKSMLGEVVKGHTLPSSVPATFKTTHETWAGYNRNLVGILPGKSLSNKWANKLVQDSTITASSAYIATGTITKVARHAGTGYPVTIQRSCRITVVDKQDTSKALTVETDKEGLCQFATDIMKAGSPATLTYKTDNVIASTLARIASNPTLVTLKLASVPANVAPISHDGQPLSGVIPAYPAPESSFQSVKNIVSASWFDGCNLVLATPSTASDLFYSAVVGGVQHLANSAISGVYSGFTSVLSIPTGAASALYSTVAGSASADTQVPSKPAKNPTPKTNSNTKVKKKSHN